MAKFSNVFKELRLEKKITQQELSYSLGLSRSAISMYETGEREPDFKTLKLIADFFNVDTDYLLGRTEKLNTTSYNTVVEIHDNIFPIEFKKFPLLGEIACGEPIFTNEDRESYVMAGTNINADFCLKAKGDSMINARILDGDIVFIKRDEDIIDGDIYAVVIDNEATLKRVYYNRDANTVQLVAENPLYKPLVYIGEDLDHITILGKAIAFQSDVR